MKRTRVADMADRHCGKLSKGYRQRVGLAQAILHNPDVLVLDEPTAGLDPKQIIETRELIKELAGDHTIILSTHILPEVSQTCQRVVIINKGQVVAVDTPDNLTPRPERRGDDVRAGATAAARPWQPRCGALPASRRVTPADRHDGGRRLRGRERARPGRPRASWRARSSSQRLGPARAAARCGMSLEEIFLQVTTEEAPARRRRKPPAEATHEQHPRHRPARRSAPTSRRRSPTS